MSSLKSTEPGLRNYIRHYSLPEVYEALLSGLLILCPEDPLRFLEEKITELRIKGIYSLEWDMFVDESLKPKMKRMNGYFIRSIFDLDGGDMVSMELYEKAYTFYHDHLKRMCFDAWVEYHLLKKAQEVEMQRKMEFAKHHFISRKLRVILHRWNAWTELRKKQQALAAEKIQRVFDMALHKVILKAWRAEAQECKKTREYFERLERGELEEYFDIYSSPSDEAKDEISQLPRRAALKIFSHLDIVDLTNCSAVCRFWKILTQSSTLWSRINFSVVKHKIQDKVVANILRKYRPYLVHLNLRGCSSLLWPSFKCISECKNLQDLNLSECTSLTDGAIKVIVENCSALLYLNLSYTDITNGTLRMLSRCCQNLQYLSLAYCRKFTDKGLQYLSTGKGCHKIIYLDLSGCSQISVDGFRFIAAGCTWLQHLEINDMVTLTDSCIIALAEKCLHIQAVSLLGSPHLSDAAFKALVQGRKLSKVKIEGNSRMTDATLKLLSKHCLSLTHVYITDCPRLTDSSLKALSALKTIVVLNIADCVRVSDPGIRHFLEGPSGSKVRELNITNCFRVSDITLLRIAQRCHSLTYLRLCYCEAMTDAGFEVLGNLSSLLSIDLSGTGISDQSLAVIGSNTGIKELTLSECPGITDMGIQKFCTQVKGLEHLDISHCFCLTNQSLKTLAFCCHLLTSLNIAGCPKMTDLSIQYLSGVCHYLQFLDISGCTLLSDKAVRYLLKGCKQLRVLKMLYCRNISK
ncbi:dynein regulatory complex subunit 6 [Protopterus annectens]|uniref:dynein regulatory complex subunit 6 n=1 Tax=Protopterus annectens TaxID=7888 RepID=UPI001CFBE76F|nr:dynein regulatory complex subunit 6 [Protopterus annectens]